MHNDIFKRAPHNPPHLFLPNTLYMLTASTYQRGHLMLSSNRNWNPVKHGLCNQPEEYPFSNYKEFLSNGDAHFNFANMDEVTDVPEF